MAQKFHSGLDGDGGDKCQKHGRGKGKHKAQRQPDPTKPQGEEKNFIYYRGGFALQVIITLPFDP